MPAFTLNNSIRRVRKITETEKKERAKERESTKEVTTKK